MSTTCPARLRVSRSLAMAGRGDGAAHVLELVALRGGAAHLGVEAKTLRADTAHGGRRRRLYRDGLQAQYVLPRPRSKRNAIGTGRRLQGPEREIRMGVDQIRHPPLFDEIAFGPGLAPLRYGSERHNGR
ncbi:MAG: hypothetical protein ACREYF_15180 [Gammaproteobacteria bacterium]